MVGRPSNPVDPRAPFATFANGLRALKETSKKTYKEIAAETTYCVSVLSSATTGQRLPSLEVTLAIARACGGNENDWTLRWAVEAARTRQRRQP